MLSTEGVPVEVSADADIVGPHTSSFKYHVGEVATAGEWDPDPRVECTHGLHFFMSFEEAKEWVG